MVLETNLMLCRPSAIASSHAAMNGNQTALLLAGCIAGLVDSLRVLSEHPSGSGRAVAFCIDRPSCWLLSQTEARSVSFSDFSNVLNRRMSSFAPRPFARKREKTKDNAAHLRSEISPAQQTSTPSQAPKPPAQPHQPPSSPRQLHT